MCGGAIARRAIRKAFFDWAAISQALGHLRIESPPADAVHTLWQMMGRYEDLPIVFCDASLVDLAIQRKIHRIATTDVRDFSAYRLPGTNGSSDR